LDGSQKQVVVPTGNWGALSPDGSQVAYSASDNGIHIVDIASQTEKVLPGSGGFNLHWSPDGNQIAYVGMGDGVINSVFVISTDGTQVRQISDFSYESVIGWASEDTLYFVAPFTGGAAWKVYAYDLASGTVEERFTIENGTPKFLNPKISPDGNWIAYRGRDNSSLYLVRTDGSDMHMVLDNVGAVGIEWSRSGWVGVSLLRTPNSDESVIVLVQPEGCEVYLLPATLNGDLEGLFIP
jgi:Tol biopolymer transport system component